MGEITMSPLLNYAYNVVKNSSNISQFELRAENMSEYVDPDYPCLTITDETMYSHMIHLYASLACVIVGLIGNMLSVLVFSSKDMWPIASNFYLLMLAVSDSMYLLSVFLGRTLTTLRCLYFNDKRIDIINRNAIFCKLFQFMLDLFSDYSTCLIMAFTIERYIACYLPLRYKELCTVWRAKMYCFMILIFIAICIAPSHFLCMDIHDHFDVCIIQPAYETIFFILYVIEMLIFRIIAVLIIIVLNIFVLIKVTKVQKANKRRSSKARHIKNKTKRHEHHNKQLTIILILISTTYTILFIPVVVTFVLWKLARSNMVVLSIHHLYIAKTFAETLYVLGFTINFFLYAVSGRTFRKQLKLILCQSCHPKLNRLRRTKGSHSDVTELETLTSIRSSKVTKQ